MDVHAPYIVTQSKDIQLGVAKVGYCGTQRGTLQFVCRCESIADKGD